MPNRNPESAAAKLLSDIDHHQGMFARVSVEDVRTVVTEMQRLREYERTHQRVPHLGQKEGVRSD